MNIRSLKQWYKKKKTEIKKRLKEFKSPKTNKKIFEELCFCILTANASARMGLRSISAIKDKIITGDNLEIRSFLKGNHRFYKVRPKYIVHTRKYLKKTCGLNIKKLLKQFKSPLARRQFFAETKDIKGIGYKEASHFLRNIGYSGYAILDKHILSCLKELKVITHKDKDYLEVEKKMKKFSGKIKIDMDELDLLMWSYKTGEILK
ncbi:MAG: N-glycosylase/DNA lyase [Elusimicrobia bacterium]|nr:N-glycosylase/DNA lyase [Elusimicrobiota bacterium]